MKISDLYEKFDLDLINNDFKGDITLCEDMIVWSFDSDKHGFNNNSVEDIETYEGELLNFQFESNEEKLNEIYMETLNIIEEYLVEINMLADLTISEAIIINNIISFNIV